jgi:hypothetical protein
MDRLVNSTSARKIERGELAETALRYRCRNPKCRKAEENERR